MQLIQFGSPAVSKVQRLYTSADPGQRHYSLDVAEPGVAEPGVAETKLEYPSSHTHPLRLTLKRVIGSVSILKT